MAAVTQQFQLALVLAAVLYCSSRLGIAGAAPIAAPFTNPSTSQNLRLGFYSVTCPQAESIVATEVKKRFLLDRTITPALLRMLFHDSFVRGADASILLDSTPGHEAEKEALPNLTIRGFDFIDAVKAALELACPGVVSCADIIVLAVRDSVALAGGPKYDVPTGRLDGKVSIKEEALNLPSPAFPVEQSRESFFQKGLDVEDMVALLGAHTVGVALCGFFNDRLFNFHGTGAADPSMNAQLVTRLSTVCPNPFFTESNADPPVNLDQATPNIFDSIYFSQILIGNGILQIDQEITADPSTSSLVQSFTSTTAFFPAFVKSIIKMSNIGVLTGSSPLGEVRRQCNATNSQRASVPPPAGSGHLSSPVLPGHPSESPPRPTPTGHVIPPGHVTTPAPMGPPKMPARMPSPPGHVTTKPGPVVRHTMPAPVRHHVGSQPVPRGHPASRGGGHAPIPPGHRRNATPPRSFSKRPPPPFLRTPSRAQHVSKPGSHITKRPPPAVPARDASQPVHAIHSPAAPPP